MKIILADTTISDWAMDGTDVFRELEPYAKDCIILVTGFAYEVTIPGTYAIFSAKRESRGLGQDPWGKNSNCYRALQAHSEEFMALIQNDKEILIVGDHNGQAMDAYLYLQDYKPDSLNLHLFAIAPFTFEGKKRNKEFEKHLWDGDGLKSLCYLDSNELLKHISSETTLGTAFGYWRKTFLFCINTLCKEVERVSRDKENYYYHWDERGFVKADSRISLVAQAISWKGDVIAYAIEHEKRKLEIQKEQAESQKMTEEAMKTVSGYRAQNDSKPVKRKCKKGRMNTRKEEKELPFGFLMKEPPQMRKNVYEDAQSEVEELVPKVNGKEICEELRSMRKLLAEANGIPYETEVCTYQGACPGTCPQCDEEAGYLRQKLNEIPEEKRVYPQVIIESELGQ